MNRAASAAETSLREAMRGSPDTLRAFEAYLIAVGEQQSTVTEQIFESGYETAMQMLLVGTGQAGAYQAEIQQQVQRQRHGDFSEGFFLL